MNGIVADGVVLRVVGEGAFDLALGGMELKGCRTRLFSGGGIEHALVWERAGGNAESMLMACSNELGDWKLELKVCVNGGGVKGISIAFSGMLRHPLNDLRLEMLNLRGVKADHVLSQGIRMGGCESLSLPVSQARNLRSHYQLVMRRGGNYLQLAYPLRQAQPEFFDLSVSGDCVSELAAVAELKHFGGTEIRPDVLEVYVSGDGLALMEDWAEANTEVRKDVSALLQPGWNSWDYYRWTITEDEVLRNAELIAKDPVLSKHVKRIIVDDGWQYCYGEWEANPLFPHGMEWLARELTKMGFEPGLWFAPTIIEPHSRIAQMDYDMLACGESGIPCLAYECMRRYGFVLDPTVEKSRRFMADTFRRYAGMGYKYFKLDFLGSTLKARRFADANVPRSEIIRKIVEVIHGAVDGKAALLGCNYHFDAGNAYVDSVRIASDIHSTWHALTHNVQSVAMRYWSNKRWWVNDPDFALCRGFDTSSDSDLTRLLPCLVFNRPEEERDIKAFRDPLVDLRRPQLEMLLSIVIAAGGAVNLSDNMCRLNESGLDLARRTVAAEPGEAAKALDLFQNELPERWLQKVGNSWRVLLLNWSDEAVVKEFDLGAHGIEAKRAVNFWNDRTVELENNRIVAELPPRSCLLTEVTV